MKIEQLMMANIAEEDARIKLNKLIAASETRTRINDAALERLRYPVGGVAKKPVVATVIEPVRTLVTENNRSEIPKGDFIVIEAFSSDEGRKYKLNLTIGELYEVTLNDGSGDDDCIHISASSDMYCPDLTTNGAVVWWIKKEDV